jgi:hypothetical protein
MVNKSLTLLLRDNPSLGPQSMVNPFHEPKNKNDRTPIFISIACGMSCNIDQFLCYIFIWLTLLGMLDPFFNPLNWFKIMLLWSVITCAIPILFIHNGLLLYPYQGKTYTSFASPIIVYNHTSLMYPIFIFYHHLFMIVFA